MLAVTSETAAERAFEPKQRASLFLRHKPVQSKTALRRLRIDASDETDLARLSTGPVNPHTSFALIQGSTL